MLNLRNPSRCRRRSTQVKGFTLAYPEMTIPTALTKKHPDFVLSSADTSIKVTVLPLTFVVYSWSEYCEMCTGAEKIATDFDYLHFLGML